MQKEFLNTKTLHNLLKRKSFIHLIRVGILTVGICFVIKKELERVDKIVMRKIKLINKYKDYYLMYEEWLDLYQNQIPLVSFFTRLNIKKIALYGNGKIGKCFANAIKDSPIEICYYIDKNANYMIEEIPVLSLDDKLPKVDAIIVTLVNEFDDICIKLKQKCDYIIISLEDVIYGGKKD